jgi:hypothetical protein
VACSVTRQRHPMDNLSDRPPHAPQDPRADADDQGPRQRRRGDVPARTSSQHGPEATPSDRAAPAPCSHAHRSAHPLTRRREISYLAASQLSRKGDLGDLGDLYPPYNASAIARDLRPVACQGPPDPPDSPLRPRSPATHCTALSFPRRPPSVPEAPSSPTARPLGGPRPAAGPRRADAS